MVGPGMSFIAFFWEKADNNNNNNKTNPKKPTLALRRLKN